MFFVWASIVCERWGVGHKQKTLPAYTQYFDFSTPLMEHPEVHFW
jgi:hypothetical protein